MRGRSKPISGGANGGTRPARAQWSFRIALLSCLLIGAVAWRQSGAQADVTMDSVVVNPDVVIRTVPSTFFGINYSAFFDSAQGSAGSAQALAQTPIKLVRFPGGTPANYYDWAEPYYNGGQSSSWSTTSPLDLWTYAQQLGATPMFQTNYAGNGLPNPPVTPQETCAVHPSNPGNCESDSIGPRQTYAVNTPQNAAAWVAYDQAHSIPNLFEVGNEQDISMRMPDDPAFQPYIDAFNQQALAMHAVDHTAKVIGPVGTNEYFWWTLDSLGMFLKQTGNKNGTGQADGVSVHFYAGSNWADSEATPERWAAPNQDWAYIQSAISQNDTRPLPVYVSEWNLGDSDQGTGFNQTQGHALVVADMLGAFAQSGVAGEEYFDTHTGWQYGLLYGTGESRPVDSATPTYYATALWKYMGSQLLQQSQSDDAGTVMSTYSSKSADGSLHFMAINKTNSARTVQFAVNGRSLAGQQLQVASVIPQQGGVFNQDAYYNGVLDPSPQQPLPGPVDGGAIVGDALSYSVPAYSAVVLSVAGASSAPTFTPTATPNPNDTATATNTPLPALNITTSGTLSLATVAPGGTEQLTSVITSNLDIGPVNLQVAVYDANSPSKLVFVDNQAATLTANNPITLNDTYVLAANAVTGTYYYQIGVFNTAYTHVYAYNTVGTFTVGAGASTDTPTSTNTPVPATDTFTDTPVPSTDTFTPVPPTSTFTSTPLPATDTNTPVPPTSTFTDTPVPATGTNTVVPPTDTFTNTPVPPTGTFTNTPVPATDTFTPVPPTSTFTNTPVLPTSTFTSTPLPATDTNTPVPATGTNTVLPPTDTFTNTPVPPTDTFTDTPVPSTDTFTSTPVPATDTFTPVPPTSTFTSTPLPATDTNTVVPPTDTFTNTPVPPTGTFTNTPVPATGTDTNTPAPPTDTPTATSTPVNCQFVTIPFYGTVPLGGVEAILYATTGADSSVTSTYAAGNPAYPAHALLLVAQPNGRLSVTLVSGTLMHGQYQYTFDDGPEGLAALVFRVPTHAAIGTMHVTSQGTESCGTENSQTSFAVIPHVGAGSQSAPTGVTSLAIRVPSYVALPMDITSSRHGAVHAMITQRDGKTVRTLVFTFRYPQA